jgi:hypothetical protein
MEYTTCRVKVNELHPTTVGPAPPVDRDRQLASGNAPSGRWRPRWKKLIRAAYIYIYAHPSSLASMSTPALNTPTPIAWLPAKSWQHFIAGG